MTAKIVGTFKSLCAISDFEAPAPQADTERQNTQKGVEEEETIDPNDGKNRNPLRPEFHYNIQVHLPSNGTEETYINIFNAIRDVFR